jgi:hypothetical protein
MKFQVHPAYPSSRFSRWTRWQPINPPGPATNAHFTISASLLAILTTHTPFACKQDLIEGVVEAMNPVTAAS